MNKVAGYCGGEGRALKYGKGQWNAAIRAEGRLTGKWGLHVWAEKQMKTKCKNVIMKPITLHDNLKI